MKFHFQEGSESLNILKPASLDLGVINCWRIIQRQPADFFCLAPKIFIVFCFNLKYTQNLKFTVIYIKLSLSWNIWCISIKLVFCPETMVWLAF